MRKPKLKHRRILSFQEYSDQVDANRKIAAERPRFTGRYFGCC
jgi:hypothetical protein